MNEDYAAKLLANKERALARMEADKKAILTDANVFSRITVEEMDKKIVGEIKSRQTIFLCAAGALWVRNAGAAAYNLMVNSKSGAGKDYVTKHVLKILPKGAVESRTRISPTAFTYWHNKKYEPDWTWDGKVCYLSDISNNILNHDVFKVMCTEGSHATVVIKQQAVDIEIDGKPGLIITTAGAMPDDEMLRRFPIIELDESQDQTEAIMQREAEFAAMGITSRYDGRITQALGELVRVNVKIPFALKLKAAFPPSHLIMRTHFNRLLDYIKASAALHQLQRERDAEGYVIAEPADYGIARIALEKTTSNPLMIPLTRKQKHILQVAKEHGQGFSASEIDHKVTMSEKSLYVNLDKLAQNGFFKVYKEERESSYKPVKVYYYQAFEVNIPEWDEICRISTITSDTSTTTNTTITSEADKSGSKARIDVLSPDDGVEAIEAIEAIVAHNALTEVEFLKDCPAFLINNEESLGPYKHGDHARIPEERVKTLVKKGYCRVVTL